MGQNYFFNTIANWESAIKKQCYSNNSRLYRNNYTRNSLIGNWTFVMLTPQAMFKNIYSRGLRTLFLCFILFVFGSGRATADVINVTNASGEAGLIAAIAAATPGDVIVLEAGTYTLTADIDLNLMNAGSPGDLAFTSDGGSVIITHATAARFFNGGGLFNANLIIDDITFDKVSLDLTDVNDFYLTGCSILNVAAGPTHAVGYNRSAGGGVTYNLALIGNTLSSNAMPGIGIQNATDNDYNIFVEGNSMSGNVGGIVVSNTSTGQVLASVLRNTVASNGTLRCLDLVNSGLGHAEYYVSENNVSNADYGISAAYNDGTGIVRIVENNDGVGGPFIDNYNIAGIQVDVLNGAVVDVEIDNNILGSAGVNQAGINLQIQPNTNTFNVARISNNTINQTNGANGITVNLDDGSLAGTADVTIDGNTVPVGAGAAAGVFVSTSSTFSVDLSVILNNVDGTNSFDFNAAVGSSIVFENTDASLSDLLTADGNANGGSAISGGAGTVDFITGTTVDAIISISAPNANDLTGVTLTGNSPGFGVVSGNELLSTQTVAVPLGSKVGIYNALAGEGQVIPLFNSPTGIDEAYYMNKNSDNLIAAALLSFEILDSEENGLAFDRSLNNYVDINIPTLDLPDGIEDRTIELWFKRASLTNNGVQHLFGYGGSSSTNNSHFGLTIDTNTGVIAFVGGSGANSLTTSNAVTDTDWHHLAVTYTPNTLSLYLDGAATTPATNVAGLSTTFTNVEIGRDNFTAGSYFDGVIDEFVIFNDVRLIGEIQNDAENGITLPDASVVAYYKANQGQDTDDNTLITELIDENLDHGGNFYNGTLQNFSLADNDFQSNFVNSLVPTVFAADMLVVDEQDVEVPFGSTASTTYNTDWETQSTGYTLQKAFGIYNAGLSDLTIGAVTVSTGTGTSFVVNDNAPPANLAPGQYHYIDVLFTPAASITYTETVSIASNDATGDVSPYTFQVTGTGAAQAEIDLLGNGNSIGSDNGPDGSTDTRFNLGINSSITKTFTIENNGSAALTAIDVTSDNPDFVVSGWSGTGDILSGTGSVTNGSSATFNVTYQANNDYFYGEHNAVITITSTGDPNEANYIMNMRASSTDNALHFEGVTDAADDRVDINETSFNPANANDELTVEAWINLDSYGGTNSYVVGRYDESGSTNNGEFYLAVTAAGNLEGGIVAGNTAIQTLNSSSTIGTGSWTHVAMTYDNSVLRIYINGIEEDNTDITGSAVGAFARQTRMGYTDNAANNFDGQIDEVRIWDIARTPYELRQNALAQLTGGEFGLVAYFNFDDGVTEGLSLENTAYPPTDLSATGLTTSLVNFDFDGGTGGVSESNFVESNALATTGLQDIIVTNNFFNGIDQEIGDGSTIPTLDVGTFLGRADNGDFITQTYTITNDGLNDLTINSISSLTGDYNYDQSPAASTVLGPGDSFDVIVRFTGADNGTTGDNININTDDPTAGENDYDFNIAAYSLPDNALHFDGTDDVVDLANGEDIFNTLPTADSWSLLAWVKIDDISGINGILSEPGGGGNNSIIINNGTIEVYDGTGTLQGQSAAAIVPEGVWTHIAVTSQSASNTSFYINSVVDGAPQMNNAASLVIPGSGLTMGDDGNATSGYFNGAIDELIFWGSGLSQPLIQFIIDNTISGNEGGLMAYYRFDHGTAGATNAGVLTLDNTDDSGVTHDGTLATGPGFDMGAGDVDLSNWVQSYARYSDMVVRGNSAQIDIANGETTFGLSDDREFGSVALDGAGGAVATVTFDIASIGGVELDLLSAASVSFGSATPDFSIDTQPAQTVGSGSVNTFIIEFDPQSAGTKTVTVQIANDGDNNPYTFDIQGFGGSNPEIAVESAGGSAITDNEVASVADDTDMGDVGIHTAISRIITIDNTGGAVLNITSIDSNNSDFVVSGAPATVAALGSETFTVTYQANNDFTYGDDKAAVITINSDDADEATFEINFLVDVVDNSLAFDGSDDFVSIPDDNALSFGDGASDSPMTVEAWVRFNTSTANRGIVSKRTGFDEYVFETDAGGNIAVRFYDDDAAATIEKESTGFTTLISTWYHLAFTYDGSGTTDGIKIYIDGVEPAYNVPAPVGVYVAMENTASPVEIATVNGGSNFEGEIDEIRIWNSERTAAQIRASAAGVITAPTAEANLMAYFDFNQGVPAGDNSGLANLIDLADGAGQGNANNASFNGANFPQTAGAASNFSLATAFASTTATTPNIGVYGQANGNLIADGETTIDATLETDFETRDLSSTHTITYDIVNEGFAPLTITAAGDITVSTGDLDGAAFSEDLTAITGGPGFPLVLAAGASQSFSIDFNPLTANTFSESVTINSDDPDSEVIYTFNVEGIGANIGVISNLDGDVINPFNEDQGATIIDQTTAAAITDADAPVNILGATLTVSVSNNIETGEDVLGIVDQGTGAGLIDLTTTPGNILIDGTDQGSYVGGSAGADLVITFTANATLLDASNILQNITYNNTNSVSPVENTRTVTFVYNDGSADSNPADVAITVVALNDVPAIANLGAADNFTFTEDDGATIIDSGDADLTDGDNPADINGTTLTVSVSNNLVGAEDVLAINDEGTAVGNVDLTTVPGQISYDTGGGSQQVTSSVAGGTAGAALVITFNANADFAIVNDIIRNITYNNSNAVAPDGNTRTVSFIFNDGTDPSVSADVDITIAQDNDLPVIANLGAAADNPFLEGGSAVIIDGDLTFTDAELAVGDDYDGSVITVARNGGAVGDDVFAFVPFGAFTFDGVNLERSLTDVATFAYAAGTLTITLNVPAADITGAELNSILQHISYANSNGTPPANVTIDFTPDDGTDPGTPVSTTIDIYNNDSDIIATSTLSATLDYFNHTGATVSVANGLKVGELQIRDGGGTDTDGSGTTLDAITLQFSSTYGLIQEVQLFDQGFTTAVTGAVETALVDDADGDSDLNEAVFTGLSGLTTADNGTATFSVVVTFNTAPGINDNVDQIDFTVTSATANTSGSQFNATDAGGASPSITTENTIIVNATDIEITDFAGGDDDAALDESNEIGIALNVPFSVSVAAVDANGNVDVDYAANVAVIAPTPDGTFTGTDINGAALVSGAHTWSDLLFTTVRTGVTFTVEEDANSYTDTPVFTFDVSDALSDITEDLTFVYPLNIDYTAYSGNINTQADGVQVAQFVVTDGGFGLGPDTDNNGTRLDANGCGPGNSSTICPNTADGFEITVVSGLSNIDKIALYTIDATLEIGANVEVGEYASTDNSGSGIFTFNLDDDNPNWPNNDDYTVSDGGFARLGVWVTFKQGAGDITDNEEIKIEVTDAYFDTNFSALANANGAPAATPGDAPDTNPLIAGGNLIEVTGDRLIFSANDPTSTTFERGVDDFNFTIQAQDAIGNVDLDETSELVITSTGGAIFEIDGSIATTFNLLAGEATPVVYGMSEEDATTITVADNDGTTGSQGTATTLSTPATSSVASSVNIHDTTAPFIAIPTTDIEPDDDGNMNPITNILTMQFNEEVAGVAAKNITLLSLSPSVHVISIDADDPGVASDANGLVTITLPESPKGSRSYSVTVDDGAFDDSPNNSPAVNGGQFSYTTDYAGTTEWNFTTPVDATAPSVAINRNPITNGDIDIATSDNSVSFDIAFTEEITNFAESDILVTTSSDLDIGGDQSDQTADLFGVNDIILTPDGDNINWTLTITAINAPTELSTIGISIITATGRMEDEANNAAGDPGFAPVVSSDFVFDQTAPVHSVNLLRTASSSPALSGVIDDLTATLSLSVDGNNYPVANPGDGTWTLPAATIAPGLSAGTFNVIVTATDDAGNVSVDGTSNELTVDLTKPEIIAAYLFDHDTDGDLDEVTIEFSEDIQDASVELTDWTIGGATPDAVIGVGSINAFNTEDLDMADDQYVTFDVSTSMLGTGLVEVVYTKSAGTDIADIAGNENDSDAAVAEVDLALPVLNTAWQFDTDGDGNIDEIVIEMNEEVDENTAVAGNFALGNNFKGDGSSVDGILLSNVAVNALDATESDQYVTLDVSVVGTAEVTVNYTAGTLTDASTNLAATTALATDDQALPVFVSATYYDVESVDGNIDEAVVELSEPITDLVAAAEGDFTIAGATLAIATVIDNGVDPGTTDDQFFTFDISGAGANGTAALVLDYDPSRSADADIVDRGGNTLAALANATINGLDAADPIVTDVTSSTADGSYRQGDLIEIQVTFSEDVVVTGGQPALTLETGTTDRDALYTSGTGTATLTLGYSVQSGDGSGDLDYVATNSLAGSIEDASTNTADLTLPAPLAAGSLGNNKNIVIDNVAPSLNATTSFTLNGSTLTNATSVSFDIDFDDDIDGTTLSEDDFTVIVTGDVAFNPTLVLSGPAAVEIYTLTINGITGDGTIKLRVGTDVQDIAGNFISTPVTSANAFTIDNTAPEISFSSGEPDPTNTNPFALTINFDENVNGLEDGDFTISNGAATLTGGPGPLAGSGPFTLNVAPSGTQSGNYTVSLDNATITDDAGNTNVYSAGLDFVNGFDNQPPTVTASTIVEGRDLTLTSQINEVGVVYWGIYAEAASPADNASLIAGTGALSFGSVVHNLAANDINTDILLPADNTDYDLFLLSEDDLTPANQEAAATKYDVRSGGVLITAPSLTDICLEGAALVLPDIVITEDIITDFRSSGSPRTLKLELPTGFEFNTSASGDGVSRQAGGDILSAGLALAYPASNAVQITYDVPTQSSSTLDRLTITGLEIMAVGSTEYSGVTITRTGGSGDIYLASEGDARVYGTLTSEPPFNAPQIVLADPADGHPYIIEGGANLASGNSSGDAVASYTVGAITGNLGATSPFTIFALNAANAVTIYSDEALTTSVVGPLTGATSYSPTLTNLGLTTGDLGITNFWVAVTDGISCESEGTKYSVAIVEAGNSEGETVFTVDNTDGTSLGITLPVGHTGLFTGNGLTDFNYADNSGTIVTGPAASVRFVPSTAGDGGSPHTVEYLLTAADGVQARYTTIFTVNTTQTVLTSGQTKTFCYLNINNALAIENPDPGDVDPLTDNGTPDFYDIEVYEVTGGIPSEISGLVLTKPTIVSGDPTSTAGWSFNPTGFAAASVGDTLVFRMIVQNETTLGTSTYATEQVIVYSLPIVTEFDNGDGDDTFDRFYCENDLTFNLTANVSSDIGNSTGTIATGYTLTYFGADNAFGGLDDVVYDLTATGNLHNDFDPADPNRENVNPATQIGTYRISYTTPTLPSVAVGCETTVETDIAVLARPEIPTLSNDFTGKGGLVGPEYIVEYTEGTNVVPDPAAVTGVNNVSERFNWYNDASLLSSLSLNTTSLDLDGSNAIPNTNGALTKDIFFTTDHYFDSLSLTETFAGCTSLVRRLSVEVHEVPDEVIVDHGASTAAFDYVAGNEYIYEYCVADASTVATMDPITLTNFLDNNEAAESYYVIYRDDMTTRYDSLTELTAADLTLNPITDFPVGDFPGWEGKGGESLTFYISQRNHNNNYPTDIGAEYEGAESTLQKITVEVNIIPDAPDATLFTGGSASYELCSGETLENIVLTNDSDPRFEWFREDGNTGTPDLAIDGTTGFAVSGFNGRFAAEGDLAGFSNINLDGANTPVVYNYYVRQYTEYNDFTSYTGCESSFTEITITVYPDPPTPIFDIAGDPTNVEINVCEGDLGSISFTVKTTAFVDGSTVYNWYPSNDGTTLASATPRFTGATATGVDLAITTATQGAPIYFLVSQENNSSACETELASMAVLRINIYDIPLAPTIADDDIYFCEAGGAVLANQTVSGEAGASFTWYTDDNKDLLGETVIHTGATATEANLEMNIATPGDSLFYISQNQTDLVVGNGLDGLTAFAGCTSPQLEVTIHKLTQYTAPVVADASICDQDAIPTFAATGAEAGALISWYDNTPTLRFEDDATFSTLFTPDGSDNDGVNTPLDLEGAIDVFDGITTMRVTQTTDLEIEPGFAGCVSPESTFQLEIRTLPTIPDVVGSAGNGLNDHDYCSTQDAVTTLDIQTPNAALTYRWYTSSTLSGASEILVSNDESINPTLHTSYPATVAANTNTLLEYFVQTDDGGCISSTRGGVGVGFRRVPFDFNPLPVIEIVDDGAASLTDEFCFSENGGDDPIFEANVTADVPAASGAWSINSTGIIYNDDPTNATLDLDGSYSNTSIGRGDTDGGLPEVFELTYTYTDGNGCTSSAILGDGAVEQLTINPLPFLSIFDNNEGLTFSGTPRYCAGDFNLTDVTNDTRANIMNVLGEFGSNFSGSGTFSLTGEDNTTVPLVTSANSSSFSLSVLGDTIEFVSIRSFDLTFAATGSKGCTNDVTQVIEVKARPELTFNKISGGCENPAVEFEPLTIFDASSGASGRDLPYTFADLNLTWEYYRTNADGSANTNDKYPTDLDNDFVADNDWIVNTTGGLYVIDADGDIRDFGDTNIAETFLIDDPDAEGQTFSARVVAYTDDADQCMNDFEDAQFATQEVDIEISPNPTFRWDGVSLGEPTTFYLRETRLDADKVNRVYLFWDRDVDFASIIDYSEIANDSLYKTNFDTEPITTIDLVGEANDVFVYQTDPTDSDPDQNPFTEAKQYNVTVAFRTSNDCVTTLTKAVNIVPSIDVAGDYGGTYNQTFGPDGDGIEPFSLITSGWFPENLRDDVLSIADSAESIRDYSWTHGDLNNGSGNGLISNSLYPQLEGSDGYAWHTAALDETGATNTYNYKSNEDSWIYSPAFNITGMSRPMVKFTMIYNFNAGNEGAVLQHSTDGGVTWVPLGSYETNTGITTGLDWFDFDNVQADPGQQTSQFGSLTALGWAGGNDSGKTVEWVSARHSLNDIRKYLEDDLGLTDETEILNRLSDVRFRFAIAATNLDDNDDFFGFALDDFTIQERSKNVMIEQFVSASNEDGADEVNAATVSLKADIDNLLPPQSVTDRDEIILAYHSNFGFEDPFNAVNPAGPSARSIYYNVDQVTSILDGQFGGTSSSAKSGDLTWTETNLSLNSLKDPGFEIVLTSDPTATDTEVKGSIQFIANQDFPTGTEFRAYMVILEDTVEQAIGGISGFGNVMRKMLPAGSGEYVKLTEELTSGESLSFLDANSNATNQLSIQWNLANISDDANLSAIVFIQNSQTKEVYQSVKVPNANAFVAGKNTATITDVGDGWIEAKDFNMYPNPTDHEVFILFDQLIQEDMEWSIFDQAGRVFDQGTIGAGREGFSLQTDRFPSGMYYMSIRGEKSKFDFKKLMVTH